MSLTDALGFATGAACVWLAVKQNVWNWPLGIANNVLYIVIFFQARLFADMSLQIPFALLGAYGWYAWLQRRGAEPALHVARLPVARWLPLAAAVALATAGLSVFLARINDAAPFLDALTTTLSLAAMYLMTRKYLENWWVWIGVDAISVGLYLWKALPLTALLYALYLAICVVGVRDWTRSLRAEHAALAAG